MQKERDLTNGNILNNMIIFSLPLLLTNLLNSMYNIVDSIWISKLIGDEGVAITTNAWSLILFASSILAGVQILASVFVAQSYVSEDKNKIKEVVTPIYIISMIVSIITSLGLILSQDFWLKLFNTPPEVFEGTKTYITIYMLGHIFNFVAMTIIEAIRATGNSKVPLYILVTIEIANIILDPILINIGLGIKGAAIATAISMLLGLFLSLIYIYTKNKSLCFNTKYMKLKKEFLLNSAKLGIPMAIQELSTIFTIMLEVNVSNSIGIVGSTAYGIVSKLQSVIWVVGGTIRTVLTVIIGQFIGKEKYNDLNLVMKNAMKLIIAPTIIIFIFLLICAKPFCEIFSQNKDILTEAMTFLNVATFCFVLVPLCQAICGFILGIGNTRFSFIVSLIANVVEIALIVAINKIFTIPMIAIAIGITGWYVTYSIIGAIYYYSNKWKNSLMKI